MWSGGVFGGCAGGVAPLRPYYVVGRGFRCFAWDVAPLRPYYVVGRGFRCFAWGVAPLRPYSA